MRFLSAETRKIQTRRDAVFLFGFLNSELRQFYLQLIESYLIVIHNSCKSHLKLTSKC